MGKESLFIGSMRIHIKDSHQRLLRTHIYGGAIHRCPFHHVQVHLLKFIMCSFDPEFVMNISDVIDRY